MTPDTIDPVNIISAVVSFVAVLVTLITALNSTKSSAFNELKIVVDSLQRRLDEQDLTIRSLKRELDRERTLRMAYEDYIHALILQLKEAKIEPHDMRLYVKNGRPVEQPLSDEVEPSHAVE